MAAPVTPRAGSVVAIGNAASLRPGTWRMATSTSGLKSTTVAGWVAPSVVSTSTRCEPATTCALVTTSSWPIGHADPASAPPQPKAITLDVTANAALIPAVLTSCGIGAGAGPMGPITEKGLGKLLLRRAFSRVARKPGGRGATESRAFSIAEPLIWVSNAAQGLCENVRPRYHEPTSTP